MLSNVWWNAIDSMYSYAGYIPVAGLIVVLLAAAGIAYCVASWAPSRVEEFRSPHIAGHEHRLA
jgi:hypothetical protein